MPTEEPRTQPQYPVLSNLAFDNPKIREAIAHAVNPEAIAHCLFAHVSGEHAHKMALSAMGQTGLLDLGMRLGEGTGAALAAGIVKAAVRVHTGMATFAEAGVSDRPD